MEIPDSKIEGIDFFSGFVIGRSCGIEWDLSISSGYRNWIRSSSHEFEAHRCENRYALDPALKLPSLKLPNEARFSRSLVYFRASRRRSSRIFIAATVEEKSNESIYARFEISSAITINWRGRVKYNFFTMFGNILERQLALKYV